MMAGMNNPLQNSLKQLGMPNQQQMNPQYNGLPLAIRERLNPQQQPQPIDIQQQNKNLASLNEDDNWFFRNIYNPVSDWMVGEDTKTNQYSLQNQDQQDFAKHWMQKSMNQGDVKFDPIEQFVRQNYQQKSIPSLMSRIGRLNGMNTGAGRQMMAQSDIDFENQLGSMKADWERGNRQDTNRNAMAAFMQPSFENSMTKGTEGMLGPLIMAAISAMSGGMPTNEMMKMIQGMMDKQGQKQQPDASQFGSSFSIPNQKPDPWSNPNNMLAGLYKRQPSLIPNPQPF